MTDPAVPEPAVAFAAADIGYEGVPVVVGLDLLTDRARWWASSSVNGSGKPPRWCVGCSAAPLLGGSLRLFGVERQRFRTGVASGTCRSVRR